MRDKIDEFMTEMAMYAEHLLVTTGMVGTFFLASSEEATFLVPGDWANEKEKVAIVTEIKRFFQEEGVTRYVMVSEAWTVTVSRHEQLKVMPRDREDREEIVLVALVAADRAPRIKCWEIDRPFTGEAPSLKPMEEPGHGGWIEGRMLNLI